MTKTASLPDELEESSGLTYTYLGLFSLSDNNDPEFYRIDTATGKILQTIIIEGLSFIDKESIESDGKYIYIGDFGNNHDNRRNLKIVKVNMRDITDEKELTVKGEVISFFYPEQKHFSGKKREYAFDCEAMILIGDSIYLFTKQRNDKQTTLYVLPNKAGNHAARKKTVFNAGGLITSAAFNPRNQTLLLLGYQENHYSPFIWKFTDFDNSDFFSGNKECRLLVNTPIRWQTEGITFINDDEVFISCETNKEYTASLYRIKLKNIFK